MFASGIEQQTRDSVSNQQTNSNLCYIQSTNQTCFGEYQLCNGTLSICALTDKDCQQNNCKKPGQYV